MATKNAKQEKQLSVATMRKRSRRLEELAASGDIDAVCEYWTKNAPFDFSAGALQTAYARQDLEMFRALLSLGATFRLDNSKSYRRQDKDLHLCLCPVERNSLPGSVPEETRQQAAELMRKFDAADMSDVLYKAILRRYFDLARFLLSTGTDLSPWRAGMVRGDYGFMNPREGITRAQRSEFRQAFIGIQAADIVQIVDCFTLCPSVDKVALYRLDFYTYRGDFYESFASKELLPTMLEKTTMRKIVRRRDFTEVVLRNRDAETLSYLLSAGWLKRKSEMDMLHELLDSVKDNAELLAIVLRHEQKHPVKREELALDADPLSAKVQRNFWAYETCEDDGEKFIRLTRYKGKDSEVVIPPRIGRREVREISPDTFQPAARGRLSLPMRDDISAVWIPGTVREIPSGVFGPCRTSLRKVVLAEGIERIARNAFAWCIIPEIHVPDSVTQIGSGAFSHNSCLERVRVPETLSVIEPETFASCPRLKELPDLRNLKTVGDLAFRDTGCTEARVSVDGPAYRRGVYQGCQHLERVVLEDGLDTVPDAMFMDCHMLSDVQFPSTLRTIGTASFAGCAGMQSISLPEGLSSVGDRSFFKCNGLHCVHLPDSLEKLGPSAFAQCARLTDINIPARAEMSSGVFEACRSLRNIELPADLETIPAHAFRQCTSLRSMQIPSGAASIEADAFSETGLEAVRIPAAVREIASHAFSKCAKLKSVTIEGTPSLAAGIFRECMALSEVRLHDDMQHLGDEMFRGCRALSNLVLPANLMRIGLGALAGSGITELEMPASVESIGESAFAECADLAHVTFSTNADGRTALRVIPSRCFRRCHALRTIEIPEGVEQIEDSAFLQSGVERVVLPASLKKIGSHAFKDCTRLREVVFRETANRKEALVIGPHAFDRCGALQRIALPAGACEIQNCSFKATALTEIEIPAGVRTTGMNAFSSCKSLRSVRFLGSGNDAMGYGMFAECPNLERVQFEGEMQRVSDAAFQHSGLRKIALSSHIRTVGDNAFNKCRRLECAELPGVTSIGKSAFEECRALRSVVLSPDIKDIRDKAFRECTRLRTVSVSADSASADGQPISGAESAEANSPHTQESVESGASAQHTQLSQICIPQGAAIGAGAFSRCPGLANSEGTVCVNGVIFGSGRETQYVARNRKGVGRVHPDHLTNTQELYALVLPSGETRFDTMLVPPEIMYRTSSEDADRPVLSKQAQVGDTVLFGKFPITDSLVRQPIEWVVCEVLNGTLFLRAKYGLFWVPRWRVGTRDAAGQTRGRVQELLNTAFRQTAFSPEERAHIAPKGADGQHDIAAWHNRTKPAPQATPYGVSREAFFSMSLQKAHGRKKPEGTLVQPCMRIVLDVDSEPNRAERCSVRTDDVEARE